MGVKTSKPTNSNSRNQAILQSSSTHSYQRSLIQAESHLSITDTNPLRKYSRRVRSRKSRLERWINRGANGNNAEYGRKTFFLHFREVMGKPCLCGRAKSHRRGTAPQAKKMIIVSILCFYILVTLFHSFYQLFTIINNSNRPTAKILSKKTISSVVSWKAHNQPRSNAKLPDSDRADFLK